MYSPAFNKSWFTITQWPKPDIELILAYTGCMQTATLIITACLMLNIGISNNAYSQAVHSKNLSPLPMRVSNNAVTAVTVAGRQYVVSFAGIAAAKKYSSTLDLTFVLDSASGLWTSAKAVPGGVGRLAATAVSVGEKAYVFGGYTVADDGAEVSTIWVHRFDPLTGEFEERAAMPVPVDDALALSYQNRYIYLVSGWHDYGNVNLVQLYDSNTDSWVQATPIPGKSVFGHAGGIVGNRMLYCDGVTIQANADKSRDFVANTECFLGIIDVQDNRRIDWRRIESHPGSSRYRMAATGIVTRNAFLFLGGSDNPYNYNGMGYDGKPSEPAGGALLFDLESLQWRQVAQQNPASMDHRGLVPYADGWLTVGGMLAGQAVTDRVTLYSFGE